MHFVEDVLVFLFWFYIFISYNLQLITFHAYKNIHSELCAYRNPGN